MNVGQYPPSNSQCNIRLSLIHGPISATKFSLWTRKGFESNNAQINKLSTEIVPRHRALGEDARKINSIYYLITLCDSYNSIYIYLEFNCYFSEWRILTQYAYKIVRSVLNPATQIISFWTYIGVTLDANHPAPVPLNLDWMCFLSQFDTPRNCASFTEQNMKMIDLKECFSNADLELVLYKLWTIE